jgi:hypothetical protein
LFAWMNSIVRARARRSNALNSMACSMEREQVDNHFHMFCLFMRNVGVVHDSIAHITHLSKNLTFYMC